MTAEFVGKFVHESPEWHAARKAGIGGSEIAAILGLSKWESRYSLWLHKKGLIPDRPVNDQMTVGTYVEDAIIRWWHDQHDPEWSRHGANNGTWRNVDRPWQIANPDRIVTQTGGTDWKACAELRPVALLECKFQVYETEWGRDGSDEIPPYYLAQCRWYLDVFGLDTCYVGVLFGGSGRFAEFVVHPNDEDTALMRYEAQQFMDSLERGERPDVDEHGATYEAIRHEVPGVGSGDIEVSGEVAEQCLTNARDRNQPDDPWLATDLAEAQVHATLALAAATVNAGTASRKSYTASTGDHVSYTDDPIIGAWEQVTS